MEYPQLSPVPRSPARLSHSPAKLNSPLKQAQWNLRNLRSRTIHLTPSRARVAQPLKAWERQPRAAVGTKDGKSKKIWKRPLQQQQGPNGERASMKSTAEELGEPVEGTPKKVLKKARVGEIRLQKGSEDTERVAEQAKSRAVLRDRRRSALPHKTRSGNIYIDGEQGEVPSSAAQLDGAFPTAEPFDNVDDGTLTEHKTSLDGKISREAETPAECAATEHEAASILSAPLEIAAAGLARRCSSVDESNHRTSEELPITLQVPQKASDPEENIHQGEDTRSFVDLKQSPHNTIQEPQRPRSNDRDFESVKEHRKADDAVEAADSYQGEPNPSAIGTTLSVDESSGELERQMSVQAISDEDACGEHGKYDTHHQREDRSHHPSQVLEDESDFFDRGESRLLGFGVSDNVNDFALEQLKDEIDQAEPELEQNQGIVEEMDEAGDVFTSTLPESSDTKMDLEAASSTENCDEITEEKPSEFRSIEGAMNEMTTNGDNEDNEESLSLESDSSPLSSPDQDQALTFDIETLKPKPHAVPHSPSKEDTINIEDALLTPSRTSKVVLNDDETLLHDFLNRAKASKAAKIAKQEHASYRRDSDVIKEALKRDPLSEVDVNASPQSHVDGAEDATASPTLQLDLSSLKPHAANKVGSESPNRRPTRERRTGVLQDSSLADQSTEAATELGEAPSVPEPEERPLTSFRLRRHVVHTPVRLEKTDAQIRAQSTKNNTRRNKGGSVPVKQMLVKLKSGPDPFESAAVLSPVAAGETKELTDGRRSVRWNEELVSFFEGERSNLALETAEEALNASEEKPRSRRKRQLGGGNGTPAKPKAADADVGEGGDKERRGRKRSVNQSGRSKQTDEVGDAPEDGNAGVNTTDQGQQETRVERKEDEGKVTEGSVRQWPRPRRSGLPTAGGKKR